MTNVWDRLKKYRLYGSEKNNQRQTVMNMSSVEE